MEDRYINNIGVLFSETDQNNFLDKTIGVLGCGGQGGYVATFLARLGIKKIILFDGDKFSISNLNRQNGAFESTIGKNKCEIIASFCEQINSKLIVEKHSYFFTGSKEDIKILSECDYIFDEMDYSNNITPSRDGLKELITEYNIPVSGGGNAVLGCCTYIITRNYLPLFDKHTEELVNIYQNKQFSKIAQPAYLCAITAALDVINMVKFFTERKHIPIGELLQYDFYHNEIYKQDRFGSY